MDISDEFERIRGQYPALVEEYQNGTMQRNKRNHTDRILVEVVQDIAHVYTYEDYLNIVDEQADDFRFSIFSKSGTFSKRNIIRTVRDLIHSTVSTCPMPNWMLFSSGDIPDDRYIMLLACFIYCVAL